MLRGFIMVECEVGKELSAYESLKKLTWITEVHPLFGEYDFILRVQANDPDELAGHIIDELRAIPGVITTRTYMEASFGGVPVDKT
ncbi:MAG: Lrp/AsnC ligand binding domain-containing protein [Candidatus Thermoplasmatota archaeon]|nr:Lrp/AsnC ligand binding domain-containing protein [Candidatus Thermoplasmatota archaeon]